ncbi:radical SAM protein [Paenibacillus agaridevorans]|uniref:Radical SAM protein n=1 Tax=Paenibacillus agaridevorans TaxID=171404 RepID=A0A2R5EYC6_9BACL|nr:radical SAM protein [Paenibacillus agaridevorans]GBG11680.1 radical SAM protein [Paenibacillus agaridevorans]
MTRIVRKEPKTLLNKGTGFLEGYSHSLNPYSGCSFACSYCYVRGMPVSLFRGEEWGSWVDVKQGAADVLRKELSRAKTKGPVTIFMSSSTDPYQPAEAKELVTRSLLEVMTQLPPDFLLVQTRSPLVTRDIDLLLKLGERVRVSMTIETDREDIRRAFTPSAPPIAARLRALRELAEAGVPTQAAIAPLLPSSEGFAETLRAIVDRVCVDDYFMGDGSGGKRTKRLGIDKLYDELQLQEWYSPSAYHSLLERLRRAFPPDAVLVSQAGFLP